MFFFKRYTKNCKSYNFNSDNNSCDTMIISFTYLISLEINILGCKMSQILHMLFTNEKILCYCKRNGEICFFFVFKHRIHSDIFAPGFDALEILELHS